MRPKSHMRPPNGKIKSIPVRGLGWFVLFLMASQWMFGQENSGVAAIPKICSYDEIGFHSRDRVKQSLFSGFAGEATSRPPLQPMAETKSVFKAVLFSLLVPGMGELYADRFEVGRSFVISESGLWLTYAGFRLYGGLLRDDARDFARTHAQADPTGKADQFYVDLGNFRDVYEYNEKQLRDREIQKLYDPDAGYFWRWDDTASRLQYRDLRVSSDAVFNNSRFVVGAIIVNHVVSALNAARVTLAHNRSLSGEPSVEIRTTILGSPGSVHGVALSVSRSC